MFKKKYVFETKRTRSIRYLQNSVWVFAVLALVYIFQAIILISVSKKETESAEAYFFNRNPDLIVVFTGDAGRIPFALKKLKKHSGTHLFITGV